MQLPKSGPLENWRRTSRKDRIQLLPNIVSVEKFHTGDFPGNNIEYQHPLIGCQGYIPMTGTEATLRLWLRVERGAEVAPTAASVPNGQAGDLGSEFRLALLFEKLPKLGSERGERIGEQESSFSRLVHGMS